MTFDDIKTLLAKRGPLKTSEIAEELNEDSQKVSVTLSYQKSKGAVVRDDDAMTWSLATGSSQKRQAVEPQVEVLPPARQRRARYLRGRARTTENNESDHQALIADKLANQTLWAEEALEAHLAKLGDPKTKVLVDNLLAAKAAQAEWAKEA